jgi:hypothetical protein
LSLPVFFYYIQENSVPNWRCLYPFPCTNHSPLLTLPRSCTPTTYNLYLTNSLATEWSDCDMCRFLTF